jgi:hypothetical protein
MTLPSVGHSFVERSGINHVAAVVNDARCLWRETLMHDVGIDGQIEYVNSDDQATGRIVLVQVKSGASYFSSESASSVPYYPAEKHRTYWEQAPLPVILILHNPESRETYWVDARSALRGRRNQTAIEVPKAQIFNDEGVKVALEQLGPLPSAPFLPTALADRLLDHRNPSLGIDFFDLFVHGLVGLAESLYFGMDLVMDIAEIKAAYERTSPEISLSSTEYDFILEFVRLLVEQDLARVDFDAFMRYWEKDEYVSDFISPLTARGLEVSNYIAQIDPSTGIRVIQDKPFQGIPRFEHLRRVPVVETFKSTLRPAR